MDSRWHLSYLLRAPYRLGFFLALVVLVARGTWWALVQLDQATGALGLSYVLAPAIVHAVVMTFGIFPLFFAGFLFTAGPKWLSVQGPGANQLLWPLGLQTAAWLLWLIGSHLNRTVSLLGLTLCGIGLAWTGALFCSLTRMSRVDDKMHTRSIGFAFSVGCVSIVGLLLSLVLDADDRGLTFTFSGLWGFVLLVFVSAAHRMLPFFTSNAMPFIGSRRPLWALRLMQTIVGIELVAPWVDVLNLQVDTLAMAWPLVRGSAEVLSGSVLLWLAVVWGQMQSLSNRLLGMLHMGFMWLGLALTLGGAAQFASWATGEPVLALGQVHALAMGCLTSLMLAMVTRVACAHSGRAIVVDTVAWVVFLALQGATVARVAGTILATYRQWFLLSVAIVWLTLTVAWSLGVTNLLGRLAPSPRPGKRVLS